MDPLNNALIQLLKYIRFPLKAGEPIEIKQLIERLHELHLLSEDAIQQIEEVLSNG